MPKYSFCGKPLIIEYNHAWTIANDGRRGVCLGFVHTCEDGRKYLVGTANKGFLDIIEKD